MDAEAAELRRVGHEVRVLAPGPARVAPESGAEVTGLGAGALFDWPGAVARARERPVRALLAAPFVARAVLALRQLGPFDRTVLHFAVPSGFPIGLAASGEVEVVAHGTDVRWLVAAPPIGSRAVVRAWLARGATFRFASARGRDALVERLGAEVGARLAARSRVEAPSIRVPDVRREAAVLRASLGLGASERLFVACGRLIAGKRVDRAIGEAKRAGAAIVVVGDGPERASLERLARETGARATFVGRVPRDRALAWIAAADRLVHSSEAEGAPTVVREARALGVPVLATAVGDVAAWAAEDDGIELVR